jgi:ubiquinone/menaquinone biosynthesis C-methylase UbiE
MIKAEHQEQIVIEATDYEESKTDTGMMSLDVGCGNNPKGNVNCDIYREVNPQVRNMPVYMDAKNIPNFVLASGEYLPFKSNTFRIVYSHKAIQSVSNPQRFLHELIRVSNEKVELKAYHRYGRVGKGKFHQAYFSQTWFICVLRLYKVGYEVACTYRQFPLSFVPNEIHVIIYKQRRNNL